MRKGAIRSFRRPFSIAVIAALLSLMCFGTAFAATSSQQVNSGWNEVKNTDDGSSYGWKLYSTVTVTDGVVSDVVVNARGNNMVQVPETEQPYYEPCHYLMEDKLIKAGIVATQPSSIDAIDTVSGATHTSNTIKKATKEALATWNKDREAAAKNAIDAIAALSTSTDLPAAAKAARAAYESLDETQKGYILPSEVAAIAQAEVAAAKEQAQPAVQAAQIITPAKAVYKVKANKVKKKRQTIAVKFNASGGGAITYGAAKSGKVSIAKNGKVTVKKGAKKKTYTLKVRVTAAANGNYAATTEVVLLKVKVA